MILPLPLQGTFTYQLSPEQSKSLGVGHRVAVSFGKRKIYTGVIKKIHNEKPEFSEIKPIEFSYDKDAHLYLNYKLNSGVGYQNIILLHLEMY